MTEQTETNAQLQARYLDAYNVLGCYLRQKELVKSMGSECDIRLGKPRILKIEFFSENNRKGSEQKVIDMQEVSAALSNLGIQHDMNLKNATTIGSIKINIDQENFRDNLENVRGMLETNLQAVIPMVNNVKTVGKATKKEHDEPVVTH